ncbi:similar to dolichyl-diphosphooligosaccharide-protein glycosyltransferase subunit [Plenodomus lingam JN3]|uniref:Dolichyl-diphosphooligosaccharide--protein glycosyltransferase subunit WBP1 n=1 Tax=Leptosphaeria maculans (strain JN3 / isolate v23.1.3 / race Av1-4-5-6-7-8) TaxID=985895 RepID=E5AD36_LEPMJ|nr:similar to dolichyl-diphosphooligosaccharide-protein glycosyltransferase subunit [Plenodomus lingam JN3]CBY02388.1 similar to dolichyl-diphosphooligosaccharide-protein glycosyltransferase subunit [Plenodomus lingam JN3]
MSQCEFKTQHLLVLAASQRATSLQPVLFDGSQLTIANAPIPARGFTTTIESPRSKGLSLLKHGERAYDHVVLLPAKSKGLGPALAANTLLEFMKKEGNILLGLSDQQATPAALHALLLELDIVLPSDKHTTVVDHFNYDSVSASEQHDILLVPFPGQLRPDVKNYFAGDGHIAVPGAVGQVLGNESPLISPILRAPSTAYSYNPKDEAEGVEDPFAVGSQLNLVSAHQANNGACLTVVGSAGMLQNKWFAEKAKLNGKAITTANRLFAEKLSAWTFKETGVVSVGKILHYQDEGVSKKMNISHAIPENNPGIYRVKSDVHYQVEISEYDKDHLVPFVPPPTDALQLEFSMLSPFHRLNLSPVAQTANATIFGVGFKTPDQHGIFNFHLKYRRPFVTNINEKRQVTVRHFAHNEWPRSWEISGAWVWIAGIWVTVAGWLAFVVVWLYSAPARGGVKKTQ